MKNLVNEGRKLQDTFKRKLREDGTKDRDAINKALANAKVKYTKDGKSHTIKLQTAMRAGESHPAYKAAKAEWERIVGGGYAQASKANDKPNSPTKSNIFDKPADSKTVSIKRNRPDKISPKVKQKVSADIENAYSDVTKNDYDSRNLMFNSSTKLSVEDAYEIAKNAMPDGYNDFTPEALKKLPKGASVRLGREMSPVAYVSFPKDLDKKAIARLGKQMKADETVIIDQQKLDFDKRRYEAIAKDKGYPKYYRDYAKEQLKNPPKVGEVRFWWD